MAKEAVMKVLHNVDPAYLPELEKEIWDAVGKFGTEVWGQECLVAPFMRPSVSKGGIITDATSQSIDDQWQSKSFMVLQIGGQVAAACKKLGIPVPEIGKWYWGYPNEHDHVSVKGTGSKNREPINGLPYRKFSGWPCRMVAVGDIRGTAPRPWEFM